MIKEIIKDSLHWFELEDFKSTYFDNLSGGNKWKVHLAVAMLGNPKILVLDEPTSGVDTEAKKLIWNSIVQISW